MLKRSPRLALLVPAVVAFVALTASFAQALPATAADDTGMVDGPVRAIAQAGNLLWVGGQFSNVLDQQGNNLEAASNLAVFNANTGVAVTSIPLPIVTWTTGAATVYDMSLAPDGTLYFTGNFDAVNGVTRYNVAAINSATGALLPFAPHSEAAQAIYTNGSVIYVGGPYLRAFRPNGTALAGWTSPQTWISPTLRGHTVYATFRDIVQMGGTLVAACVCDKMFDANHPSPDGISVKAVVEIDAATGILRSWAPSNLPLGASGAPTFGESVIVHAAPDTGLATIYLGAGGNDFTAAYDFQTGQEIWHTDTSGSSQAVVWHQGTLIVGGHFEWTESPSTSACGDNDHPVTTCYGTPKLTAMNPVDGTVVINPATNQPWNPVVCCKYNGIWALVVNHNDSTLWVGGEFTKIGGTWSYNAGTNTWTQVSGVKQWYFAQLQAPSATVHPLYVVSADIGTGVGSVTSDVGGINCGSACAADYAGGTVVTLTATPAAGFAFLGWAGDCTGMVSPCQVTMDQARNVTASFGVPTYTLTASKTAGSGKGKVTSDVGGINCGTNTTSCNANLVTGSSVTLTAVPTVGIRLHGVGRRLRRHGSHPAVRPHHGPGPQRQRELRAGQERHRELRGRRRRTRDQQPGGRQLRRHLQRALRLRHGHHAHGHAGRELHLQRMEPDDAEPLLRHRHVSAHDVAGNARHGHVRPHPAPAHGVEGRRRQRHGGERHRRHRLRRHVLGRHPAGQARDADGHRRRGIHLHGLGRRLLRHGGHVPDHHGHGPRRHRHVQDAVRPHGHARRNGRRSRDQRPRASSTAAPPARTSTPRAPSSRSRPRRTHPRPSTAGAATAPAPAPVRSRCRRRGNVTPTFTHVFHQLTVTPIGIGHRLHHQRHG